jgi:hypothetical protein
MPFSLQPPIIVHPNGGTELTGLTKDANWYTLDISPFLIGSNTKIVVIEHRVDGGTCLIGTRGVAYASTLTFGKKPADLSESFAPFRRTFEDGEAEQNAMIISSANNNSIDYFAENSFGSFYLMAEFGGDGVHAYPSYYNPAIDLLETSEDEVWTTFDDSSQWLPVNAQDLGNVSHVIVQSIGGQLGGPGRLGRVRKVGTDEVTGSHNNTYTTWRRWDLVAVNSDDEYDGWREDDDKKTETPPVASWMSANLELGYIRKGYWGSDATSPHGYQMVDANSGGGFGLGSLTYDAWTTYEAFSHVGHRATVLQVIRRAFSGAEGATAYPLCYVRDIGDTTAVQRLRYNYDQHKFVNLTADGKFEYYLTDDTNNDIMSIMSYMERASNRGVRLNGKTLRLDGQTVRIR